jgi:acyl-homoserine-lactone acylase
MSMFRTACRTFLPLLLWLTASATAATVPDAQHPTRAELQRWGAEAQRVTIVRDNWGVPHISGVTDADAVFGMLYAQAEDDFHRIEVNYINGLGRLAEVEGESALWRDLRMKLFIDPQHLRALYGSSPAPMRRLMDAYADGLNYYLYTHPQVAPALIRHFEPWMALAFSEGSIGGDIESVDLAALEAFYAPAARHAEATVHLAGMPPEPSGSNGFAIAPARSATGHALLLINPHTSFYFRAEVHVSSQQGLNVYGAVTWGQFFVYQGFNEHMGWMHTSGGGDTIDEYLETMVTQHGVPSYRYGGRTRPLRQVIMSLPYKTAQGMATRKITAWFSHHGPIVRSSAGKWVAVRMMNSPLQALTQSFSRTKARNYAEFRQALDLRTNSSNNTVYADDAGNIALFYGDFVPVRDPSIDWTQPVDGSDPSTEWQGLHDVKDLVQVHNPASGWIQNTNNTPFNAAGPDSPHRDSYPAYMVSQPENPRGIHAARVLAQSSALTLEGLITAAYDPELTAFERAIPALLQAWEALATDDPLRPALLEQITLLRAWDMRSGADSVATALAIYWAQEVAAHTPQAERMYDEPVIDSLVRLNSPRELLLGLQRASAKLTTDFGSWRTPWGEINRFQRLSGDIALRYDDQQPSLPISFTSGNYGSLAAFGPAEHTGTRRIYGDSGNSFVAVVEFGPRVRARSLLAGGESGDPASPHFVDQAANYSRGEFKDVLFYPEDIARHAARTYHPGR